MNDSSNNPDSPPLNTLELNDVLIQTGFTDLEQAHDKASEIAREQFGATAGIGSNVRLTCSAESIPVLFNSLFENASGKIIWESTQEIIGTLKDLPLKTLETHAPYLKGFDWAAYLTMTAIRTLHLDRLLKQTGFNQGSLLEVGAYFGSFALPLQRLGYRVMVIDRYTDYAEALEPFCQLMTHAGIEVVKTTRQEETKQLQQLGQFDGALAMAVIEHIPHTPKHFLEALNSHIKENGILAIDTPNLTGYWNCRKMLQGDSIFQDIRQQFYTEIPFEGHHREYTGDEIEWMLKEVGLKDLILHYFDYNMFQFKALQGEHIECFLRMIENPHQAGLIMCLGRKP